MFEKLRRVELDDGRELIVQYQGERSGWGAYVPGTSPPVASADTPAAAIGAYLGLSKEQLPEWVTELSGDFERELREAPRSPCPCCGFATLLNPDSYEICPVCRWTDETGLRSATEHSGANGVSLRQARENFAAFGACTRHGEASARPPKPGE